MNRLWRIRIIPLNSFRRGKLGQIGGHFDQKGKQKQTKRYILLFNAYSEFKFVRRIQLPGHINAM